MSIDYGDMLKSLVSKAKQLGDQYEKMEPDFVQQVKFNDAKGMFYLCIAELNIYHNLHTYVHFPENFIQGLFNLKFTDANTFLQKMKDSLKD